MTAEPAAPKEWDRSEGARRDIVAGGIVVAAILLFVGTGGAMMQSIVRALSGFGGGTDRVLAATLILNIALLLFGRSEEHTSELQSLMRISYAVFCLKKKKQTQKYHA